MKNLPSLKQIEYLVALDEEQHFGLAAERCHVTPSTVSAGIRDLEDLLGVVVAERNNRSVLMTVIGKEIAAEGRQLLQQAEALVGVAAQAQKKPLTGELHLGVIPTIGPFLLPKVLPDLWRRYPELRLFLHEGRTEPLLMKLRQGEIDAALVALPYDLGELAVEVLFEDGFQFACSKAHPLSANKVISQQALQDENLLLLEEGHCLRGHALEACRFDQHRNHREFAATSLFTLVQMVAANLGVTLLPDLAVKAGGELGAGLALIPLEHPSSRQIGLVWRRSSYRQEEFRQLGWELTPS
ncbi:hydrogen peroxide-inducible genes activator [Sneathiella chinensis]|uniref:LysR family transcriptional regulator n=1 Tax=Sneathiella chinensis TaxID=349750 RepID=A0ABQ5U6D7_9PROT|nr:hydrogen peroxide-inducible genes activator [Sneathiella chinensis]GLQ06783.1 LysR family transcriptional regulator [Sneathiella chinensis]